MISVRELSKNTQPGVVPAFALEFTHLHIVSVWMGHRDYLQGFNAKALDRIPVSSFLSTGQFLSWPLLSAVLAAFLLIGPLSSAFSTLKTL